MTHRSVAQQLGLYIVAAEAAETECRVYILLTVYVLIPAAAAAADAARQ